MRNGALGDAYAEMGDMGKAEAQYRKAANTNNEALTPYYMKKLGMLLESQGQNDQAKTWYEKIKTDYPTSASGRDIEKYLSRVSQ